MDVIVSMISIIPDGYLTLSWGYLCWFRPRLEAMVTGIESSHRS